MSMNLNYVRIRLDELAALQADVEKVRRLIEESEEAIWRDDSAIPETVCSIGQSWDLIANLLGVQPVDDDSVLHDAVYGASDINDDDLGYGPARFLLPGRVEVVAEALRSVTVDQLKERFTPTLFAENNIYPFMSGNDENAFELVSFYFPKLVEFYEKAAQNGDAVVVYMI